MVLVDTSVWVHFLADRLPDAAALQRLLLLREVVGHELVYGELLAGDRSGRKAFLAEYQLAPWAKPVPHEEVVEWVRSRKLHGCGVGWIDLHLLASAIAGHYQLWTADPRFADMAASLGVAYQGVNR